METARPLSSRRVRAFAAIGGHRRLNFVGPTRYSRLDEPKAPRGRGLPPGRPGDRFRGTAFWPEDRLEEPPSELPERS